MKKNFKEGDILKIDLLLNRPLHINVFQILPYEKRLSSL